VENNDIDLLIYRIIEGHYDLNVGNKQFVIQSPSSNIIYESEKIFNSTYKDAQVLGVFEDEDIYNFLVEQGQWTQQDETMLTDTLPENLKKFKKALYQSFFRGSGQDKYTIKKFIKKTKEEILRLQTIRYNYSDITCKGIAFIAKSLYITEQTTFLNNQKYDFFEYSAERITNEKAVSNISDEEYRTIARKPLWYNMWTANKNVGNLFSARLTEEQQNLVDWTIRFDNIYQSQDCPPDSVLDDHDALDGWFIIRQEKHTQQTLMEEVESSLNPKVKNAGEIFLPASEGRAEDDIEGFSFSEIKSLNSEQANSIQESKLRQIETRGHVREQDFNESQRELRIQAMNQARNTMTGK